MTTFELGALVHFTFTGADDWQKDEATRLDSPWIKRADEKHLCIVIEHLDYALTVDNRIPVVRVWDTVERNWFNADAEAFVSAS